MAKAKIAVTLDERLLGELDRAVKDGLFATRSQAVEAAVRGALADQRRVRFERECARLDPEVEKALADEGLGLDRWPDY